MSNRHLRRQGGKIEDETDTDLNDLALIQLKIIMLEKIAALEQEHADDLHPTDLNEL